MIWPHRRRQPYLRHPQLHRRWWSPTGASHQRWTPPGCRSQTSRPSGLSAHRQVGHRRTPASPRRCACGGVVVGLPRRHRARLSTRLYRPAARPLALRGVRDGPPAIRHSSARTAASRGPLRPSIRRTSGASSRPASRRIPASAGPPGPIACSAGSGAGYGSWPPAVPTHPVVDRSTNPGSRRGETRTPRPGVRRRFPLASD